MEEVKYHRTARSLIHRLTSAAASTSALSSALSEIRLLSKHDPQIRTPLAESGLVPILTHLLLLDDDQFNNLDDDGHGDLIRENAVATLLNLSISAAEPLMSCPSLLPSLSRALRGAPVLAQHAAAALYSLLSVDAYRPIIGSKRDSIVAPLISLIKSPRSPTRSVKDALKALFGLALYPLNRPALVELGAVPALFSLVVADGRTGIVEDATAVIAQVAGCYESVEAFGGVGGVRILVRLVGKGSERARENAASAMLNLAMSGGERAVGDIREVEAAEEVVRELAERGSARARSKAEELVRVLRTGRRGSFNLNRWCSDNEDQFSEQSPATSRSRSSSDTYSF